LEVNGDSASGLAADSVEDKAKAQKKLVEELKADWKLLWNERLNDPVRAEGNSIANYESQHVERGTVIHATRDFKTLNFKEILQTHIVENPERFIQPDHQEGGWNKFVKTQITNHQLQTKRAPTHTPKKPEGKQPKKGGRGWLHTT
jgi:hypothetical protein